MADDPKPEVKSGGMSLNPLKVMDAVANGVLAFTKAKDTNPDVVPGSVLMKSGAWASLGGVIGLVLQVNGLVSLPAPMDKWQAVIGAVLGFIANSFFHKSYVAK